MKKVTRIFTIAALAFGMTMAVSCNKDPENEGGNGGNGGNGGGNDNGPAVLIDESFDNGIPAEWTIIDADNDGHNWEVTAGGGFGVNGTDCASSASYDNNLGAFTPDNYLVTPELDLAGEYTISYQVNAQDDQWGAEHYAVLVGTIQNGNFVAKGTIYEGDVMPGKTASAWQSKSFSLKDYKGQKLCIAFRHFNCTDMFRINIDNVKVSK